MNTQHNPVDHSRMREMNLAFLLSSLREHPSLSRAGLAELTGLTKPTISSLVKELIEQGFVREVGLESGLVGRPSISLELNPHAGYILGAEIGVDFISVILTDFTAEILWRARETTDPGETEAAVLEHAVSLIARAAGQAPAGSRILGLGLGVPGLVDESNGDLLFAPNLGWRDLPLYSLLAKRFDFPIFVDNEANLAALGESLFGAARQASSVIFVSSGVGLGGGIVLDRQLLKGANGFGGEFGHMTVEPNGIRCRCGNVGCWETLVSQWAVFRRIREAATRGESTSLAPYLGENARLTVERVIDAAAAGDQVTLAALEETGRYLGLGIANLINAFNPEMVVFGGALSAAFGFLRLSIEAGIAERALYWPARKVHLVPAQYGKEACPIGGVASIYQGILSNPVKSRP
jgi:glucokinase-like ROK family protein